MGTTGVATLSCSAFTMASSTPSYTSNRPPLTDRTFISQAVENTIKTVKKGIKNPELSWLFENCFPKYCKL